VTSNIVTATPDISEDAEISQRLWWRNDDTSKTEYGRVSTLSPRAATHTNQWGCLIPSYIKTTTMGKTITVNTNAATHISHVPRFGARGCNTTPKIRKAGNKKNKPPTMNLPKQ